MSDLCLTRLGHIFKDFLLSVPDLYTLNSLQWPIIAVSGSEASTAFARCKTEIVGSNEVGGMDVRMLLF
jgi:hypothetical protein